MRWVYGVAAVAVVVLWLIGRARRQRPVASHSAEYEAALRSAHWRLMKRVCWARAGGRCEARWCRKTKGLSLHHWTYKDLGHESPEQLQYLCPKHHRQADAKRRRHPRRYDRRAA